MSKPREWWIWEKSHFEHIAFSEPGPGRYHVIEKSAFDKVVALGKLAVEQVQKEADKLGSELEAYRKAKAENDERFQLEIELKTTCAIVLQELSSIEKFENRYPANILKDIRKTKAFLEKSLGKK